MVRAGFIFCGYIRSRMTQNTIDRARQNDDIICVNGEGKIITAKRYYAESKNWQKATGFRPQVVEKPNIQQNFSGEQTPPPAPTVNPMDAKTISATPPTVVENTNSTNVQQDDDQQETDVEKTLPEFTFTESGTPLSDEPGAPEQTPTGRPRSRRVTNS